MPESPRDGMVPGLAKRLRRRPEPSAGRPRVTVIIPCYNYEQYVADAISSALTQDHVDVDVVVVDDRSTDSSAEVVARIAMNDARVRLVVHESNRGAVETFNDGLAVAQGKYLVRLDADDLLTPGSLQRATALGEALPSVGLIYGHPLHFSGKVLPPARRTPTKWTVWPGESWLTERCRTGINVITSPEVVMRKSVVDRVGGQRDLAHTHDMEMWLRLSAVADVAYIEGADQAWHRDHPLSLSNLVDTPLGDIDDRQEAFRTLFDWADEWMPGSRQLRLLSERAIADEALQRIVHMHDRGSVDVALREQLLDLERRSITGPEALPTAAAANRAMQRGDNTRPRPWHVARALRRRLINDRRFRRWHRRGVFHR